MKPLIFVLSMLFQLSVSGQIRIRVINGVTRQPVPGIYCEVLQNNDKWIDIGQTNASGIFTAKPLKKRRRTTYQLDISNSRFKPFSQELNLSDSAISVTIYPDSSFREKDPSLVYSDCSSIFFGNYSPKEPQSLADLPEEIRNKLTEHLVRRLGEDFYSRLTLSGGQIVDLKRLYKVDRDAKHYQWTPYSYYLCFSFSDFSRGIGYYNAKIVLDKSGNVIEEIGLPDIGKSPEKAGLISLEEAKAIIRANNHDPQKAYISLSYDPETGSMAWKFQLAELSPDLKTKMLSLFLIDAHNGKIIVQQEFDDKPRPTILLR